MLKCHEFTITVHHVWSVEEKRFLPEPSWDSMLIRSWDLSQLGSTLLPRVVHWCPGRLHVTHLTVWKLRDDDQSWDSLCHGWQLALGTTALCFGSGIETRRLVAKLWCELYSWLRQSSRLWNVLHRVLRAGRFEKETEEALGSGVQSMITRP